LYRLNFCFILKKQANVLTLYSALLLCIKSVHVFINTHTLSFYGMNEVKIYRLSLGDFLISSNFLEIYKTMALVFACTPFGIYYLLIQVSFKLLLLLLFGTTAQSGLWPRHTRFLDHIQRRATVGRTLLDE
jgi:hypothetical protein